MVSSNEVKSTSAKKIALDPWLFGITLVLLFVVYSDTVFSFYNVYSDEGSGQSHAPLLLVVVIYLIYRAWSSDRQEIVINHSSIFIVLLAGMSLLWLASELMIIEAGQQVSLIVMLALVVVSLLGMENGRRYLFPVLLLLSVLPLWNILVPYLQENSAVFSSILLRIGGLTITRDGYLLIIPNGTFEVADACSGVKYLVVSVILALVQTQLTRVDLRTILVYLILAILLALVSNVIRISIVVLIGYHYGLDHALVQDHNSLGWVVFALLIFPFILFGEKFLHKRSIGLERNNSDAPAKDYAGKKGIYSVLFVAVAFSLGPVLLLYFSAADRELLPDRVSVDTDMGAWQQYSSELEEWKPLWTKGDRELKGRFHNGGDIIDLYATQFLKQESGFEAVNVSHRVYDIDKWSRISRSAKVVSLADGREISVEETVLKSPANRRRLVWQWYGANGGFVQGNVKAKLTNLMGILSGRPDVTVYILSKEVVKGEDHATEVLSDFAGRYLSLQVST